MMTKLVIESVPDQAINFVKEFCKFTGQDEEEFWRQAVACEIDGLVDIIAPALGNKEDIRGTWDLDEAIKSLKTPRGPRLRKLDEELYRLRERERQAKEKKKQ
jgi:hypothetical protein